MSLRQHVSRGHGIRRAWRADPADWRIAPVAGMGLPISILRVLMEAEVDTAGSLSMVLERREIGWLDLSSGQVRRVVRALEALRDAAGDPGPRRWPVVVRRK